MTEREKQIAVANLLGYEVKESELYTMRNPDILTGLLKRYNLTVWTNITSNLYLATEDGKRFVSGGQTYYDRVFNVLAEASKHILQWEQTKQR